MKSVRRMMGRLRKRNAFKLSLKKDKKEKEDELPVDKEEPVDTGIEMVDKENAHILLIDIAT